MTPVVKPKLRVVPESAIFTFGCAQTITGRTVPEPTRDIVVSSCRGRWANGGVGYFAT